MSENNEKIKRLVADLKERIDLHELAEWLGMERPRGSGNWRSPHRKDTQPSVSIFNDGRAFKDHTSGQGGGCVDLVMYVRSCEFMEAVRTLCDYAQVPMPGKDEATPKREQSLEEWIAEQCLRQADLAVPYLVEQRKIPEATVRAAIKARTVGFNTWENKKVPPGEPLHGGPAAAFIVRTMNPGHVAAVEMRYLDPALNGGVKTQTMGQKEGLPWLPFALRDLKHARTVYLVESPINALSVEACEMKKTRAIAVRGLNVEAIDWGFLHGAQVILCMDDDLVNEQGHRPGPEAAWTLYDMLAARNISALMVDQREWEKKGYNDVNDVLKAEGAKGLKERLQCLSDDAIAGLQGRMSARGGKLRVFLPSWDFAQYWKFKTHADYSDYVVKVENNDDGSEDGVETLKRAPLAGFRVAALSRVSIQSEKATFAGMQDHAPTVQFAATVQTPRHEATLLRRVFRDEDLHKKARWEEFGPVYDEKNFKRLVTILERTVHFGARKAANFVGVCWLDGKLRVNEGTDCYFEKPDKQCHYHEHVFHRGPTSDARAVIEAYQACFRQNAAMLPLVWALGAPALKCILGFWPHFEMQAKKGAGKSTLISWLTSAAGFTMFSNEQMKTSYRLVSSVGHTSLPVGWEEVSKAGKDALRIAITLLQESYQFAPHTRGSDNLRYLNAAPVMLAGEDVPAKDLTGKLVRCRLTKEKQAAKIEQKLPPFPVRRWLDWIVEQKPEALRARHDALVEYCMQNSRAVIEDLGGRRMANNYGALLLAWKLLAEFAGVSDDLGDLPKDLIAEMNAHVAETKHDREPYIWILEKLGAEIAAGQFKYPHAWREVSPGPAIGTTELCLVVKPEYVMSHMAGSMGLRDFYDGLPIKTPRVFKSQCVDAGLVVNADFNASIGGMREWHCVALSVGKMDQMGISMPVRENGDPAPAREPGEDDQQGQRWFKD